MIEEDRWRGWTHIDDKTDHSRWPLIERAEEEISHPAVPSIWRNIVEHPVNTRHFSFEKGAQLIRIGEQVVGARDEGGHRLIS